MVRTTGILTPIALLGLMSLGGCTFLPRSGPDDTVIAKQASIHLAAGKDEKPLVNYTLMDLTESVVARFPAIKRSTLSRGFGSSRKTAPVLPLGIGDIVQISLFESSAGGLFIPAEAGSRPGNYITLPSQTVDTDGNLTVPYAGAIQAAGSTAAEVQKKIENALVNRAIEPQALITLVQSRSSEVSVLGDVNDPNKLQINPGGERILDAISRAGGLSSPGAETNITLQRNGTTATVLFDELIENPKENIFVYPGDVIYANRDRRTFLAFGASGLNGRIDFEESDLTLAEAVGKAGGLLDGRADPGQVFIYRLVPVERLEGLSLPVSVKDHATYPVIFKANMRDPSTYFLAQQFQMVDKDILYVSNADSVELTKFLDIVNTVSSGTVGPISDAASGQDALRSLGN